MCDGVWCDRIRVTSQAFQVTSTSKFRVPPSSHPAVLQFVSIANFGFASGGTIEFDLSDGEVRYKYSLFSGPARNISIPFTNAFFHVLNAFPIALEAVLSVVGGADPKAAAVSFHKRFVAEIL